jgi:hypothetical protein
VRLLLLGSLLLASLDAQITTSQYDNARTGANIHETILNPRNVDVNRFGRVVRLPVDGDIYAQSLYLPNLAIPGKGTHNVVFVATEHDSVYAFDAGGQPKDPLWKVSFIDATKQVSTLSVESVRCPFLDPEVGITSTPVIDARNGTLYVLVRTKEADRFWQRLHALDARTGSEKFGGPVVIRASVESRAKSLFGLGPAQSVDFLALHENPRAALLLDRGTVYLTWGSSCDVGPYYGWVLAYDSHTLRQKGVLNTAPEAAVSGIWQSDTGPAADEEGNVYATTGNGVFNAASGGLGGERLFHAVRSGGAQSHGRRPGFGRTAAGSTATGFECAARDRRWERPRVVCAQPRAYGQIPDGEQSACGADFAVGGRRIRSAILLGRAHLRLCAKRCAPGFRHRRQPSGAGLPG